MMKTFGISNLLYLIRFKAYGLVQLFLESCFRQLRSFGKLLVMIVVIQSVNPSLLAQDRRVLVIGIDGLMPEAVGSQYVPNINTLLDGEKGFFSYGYTEDLTFSGPSWSAIINGVHYDRHGVTTNSYDGHDFTEYPNFLKRLKNHNPELYTAAYVVWPLLKNNFRTPDGEWDGTDELAFRTRLEDGGQWVTDRAEALLRNGNPHAIFYYQSDVDAAGHEHGFSVDLEGYRRQLMETDTRIGQVLNALNDRPGVASGEEEWLIILVSDHGGVGRGHSGNLYRQRLIPVILYGNAVRDSGIAGHTGEIITANPASGVLARPRNVDVSKTVLTYMGVPDEELTSLDGNDILSLPVREPADYGVNLIFNGDGNYDRGFESRSLDQVISGWRDQEHTGHRDGYHSMTLIKAPPEMTYQDEEGIPVDTELRNLFTGGRKGVHSVMSQQIELGNLQPDIDARMVRFRLSAFLGGSQDRMKLKVEFLDKNNDIIDTEVLESVIPDEGKSTLQYRVREGFVFPGTRSVRIELHAIAAEEKDDGIQSVGDRLSFVLFKNGN
ncbi:MAG: hypothetical protein EA359_02415 [Balneolaceae bacterium]|nr:MAG: hypothetical protein EA359_02415 [Balneolaceae bacterium]